MRKTSRGDWPSPGSSSDEIETKESSREREREPTSCVELPSPAGHCVANAITELKKPFLSIFSLFFGITVRATRIEESVRGRQSHRRRRPKARNGGSRHDSAQRQTQLKGAFSEKCLCLARARECGRQTLWNDLRVSARLHETRLASTRWRLSSRQFFAMGWRATQKPRARTQCTPQSSCSLLWTRFLASVARC